MRCWALLLSFGWPGLLETVPFLSDVPGSQLQLHTSLAGLLEVVPAASAVLGAQPLCTNPGWLRQGSVPRLCRLWWGHTPNHTCTTVCQIPWVLAQTLWNSKLTFLGLADAFLIVREGVRHVLYNIRVALEHWESLILAGRKGEGQTCGLKLCCCLKTCHLSQQTLNDVLFWVRAFLCCAGWIVSFEFYVWVELQQSESGTATCKLLWGSFGKNSCLC